MKYRLKEKLIELGYALSYIEEKLKEWDDCLEEKKSWEISDDDVTIQKWDQPTEEIPKLFLNTEKIFEKILVLDGDIYTVYKENTLEDKLQLADYLVCNKLCLIRFNE